MKTYNRRKVIKQKSRKLKRGGMFGFNFPFGKTNARPVNVNTVMDTHESSAKQKLASANAAFEAAKKARDEAIEHDANSTRCKNQVDNALKTRKDHLEDNIQNYQSKLTELTRQIDSLTKEKTGTASTLSDTQKQLNNLQTTVMKNEFESCMKNPKTYNVPVFNVDPTKGVPKPDHAGPNVREAQQLAAMRADDTEPPPSIFDGGKRKSKKAKSKKAKSKKAKSKKGKKTRKGGVKCNPKLGYKCPHYKKHGKHMKGGNLFFTHE